MIIGTVIWCGNKYVNVSATSESTKHCYATPGAIYKFKKYKYWPLSRKDSRGKFVKLASNSSTIVKLIMPRKRGKR